MHPWSVLTSPAQSSHAWPVIQELPLTLVWRGRDSTLTCCTRDLPEWTATDQPMWTVPALADFPGKPVSWVYDNHEKQAIPSFHVGQQLRASRPNEIKQWLETNCRERAAT